MIIDLVFIILMVMAVVKGFSRGLIVALFTFVAYIVGLAAALKLSAVVAASLQAKTQITGSWLPVISFAIVFIAVILGVRLIAKLLKKVVGLALLGWVDTLGGIVLYALLYLFIYSVILFYSANIGLIGSDTQAASKTFPYIQPIGPKVVDGMGKVIPLFRNTFQELSIFFEKVGDNKR